MLYDVAQKENSQRLFFDVMKCLGERKAHRRKSQRLHEPTKTRSGVSH